MTPSSYEDCALGVFTSNIVIYELWRSVKEHIVAYFI